LVQQYENDPKALQEFLQTLHNGNLETTMDTLLQTTITPENCHRIATLMEAYRYSPAHTSNNTEEMKHFLKEEVDQLAPLTPNPYEANINLFEMIHDFLRKFTKNEKNLTSFEILDLIIDISQEFLQPNEYIALFTISQYLKAEKMFV
jgi:hypothetical protein